MNDLFKIIFDTAAKHLPVFIERHKHLLNGKDWLYIDCLIQKTGESHGMVLGNYPYSFDGSPNTFEVAKKKRNVAQKIFVVYGQTNFYTSFPFQNYITIYGGGMIGLNVVLAVSNFPPELDHQFVMEVLELSGQMDAPLRKLIDEEFEKCRRVGYVAQPPEVMQD